MGFVFLNWPEKKKERMMPTVVTYKEVLSQLNPKERHHLLIGNGFSIGCDPRFSYRNLYEAAKARGLGDRAQAVFEKLGTNNFEAVMRLLDDGHWLALNYGLVKDGKSELANDLELIKNTLLTSIAETHPDHTGAIDANRKKAAANFFEPYHSVFSTNYDLLPVWINMISDPPPFEDGFRADPGNATAPSLVFSEPIGGARGIYFIHGALHLFMGAGGLRKHCWGRSKKRLTELVREGLAVGRYPLFVAEGHSVKKMEQIQASGYLSYCYGKFGRIEKRLITFGFSFGDSDQHVCDQIVGNEKITSLYVGVYSTAGKYPREVLERVTGMADQRRKNLLSSNEKYREKHQLDVVFFDSASAAVWG